MAAAEARANWLRYAKRCIVQDDYEGASRPPNSPPSSSQSQRKETLHDEVKSHALSPDTKWWLRPQPKDNVSPFWDPSWETFLTSVGKEKNVRIQELVIDDTLEKKSTDRMMDLDPYKCIVFETPEKLLTEMESEWIKIKKNEPWWRMADLNDLASFVSLKSLEHIDNCDLPRPQIDKGLASLNQEPKKEMSSFTNSLSRSPASGGTRCTPWDVDTPLSTMTFDDAENPLTPSSELSKAQLLEALCHSQTRAREAEKAAQQAHNEKEHVITLFLRQASHLFAYKQWLHILHLETLCLQLRRNKSQPIHTRFPDFAPWVPTKDKNPKRVRRKGPKKHPGAPRHKMGKSVKGCLLGLALAGAGLVLGWTMGWLFPAH